MLGTFTRIATAVDTTATHHKMRLLLVLLISICSSLAVRNVPHTSFAPIVLPGNRTCLQVFNTTTTIPSATCDTPQHRFQFEAVMTENHYRIRAASNGKCLDSRTLLWQQPSGQHNDDLLWTVTHGGWLQSVSTQLCMGLSLSSIAMTECTNTQVLVRLPPQPDAVHGPAPLVLHNDDDDCLGSDGRTVVACHPDDDDDRWELVQYNDEKYQIRSPTTGRCLGVASATLATGTFLCNDNEDSLAWWKVQDDNALSLIIPPSAQHHFRRNLLSTQSSSICLSASSSSSATVADCTDTTTTNFQTRALQPAPTDWYGPSPIVRPNDACINVNINGVVSEEPCDSINYEQQFRLAKYTGDDTLYQMQSVQTHTCLAVDDDDDSWWSSRPRIVTQPCVYGNDQLWIITGTGDDRTIQSVGNTNKCLTSKWIHRQTGLLGWLLQLLSWLRAFFFGRRPILGSCDDTGARMQIDAVDMRPDPWSGPIETALVASAMANRPDGTILMWSTDLKVKEIKDDNRQTWVGVFDPNTGSLDTTLITEFEHDMFCPATVHLADGRLMISGGSNNYKTTFYNLAADQWEAGPNHILPRGYHSGTLLSDGSVFVIGGSWKELDSTGGRDGALWTPSGNQWQLLPGIQAAPLETDDALGHYRSDNHMWLYEAPDGRIFHAGPAKQMHWISIEDDTVTQSILRDDDEDAMVGPTVMYDVGKIASFGGTKNYDLEWASSRTYVIDITGSEAVVTRADDMSYRRAMHNAVPLPDGDIVVVGGVEYAETFRDNYMVLTAELFHPPTMSFTKIPTPMKVPRNYHSAALLLKDGRVLTAGGGVCGRCPANHPDAEILTPPYLLDDNGSLRTRPVISSVSSGTIAVGGTIVVGMDTDGSHTFALVRFGAATHSVNLDQRRVPLVVSSQTSASFTLDLPSNEHVLLPGYYFLFAMNSDGVPSTAHTVFRSL